MPFARRRFPDGRNIVTASYDNTVRVYSAGDWQGCAGHWRATPAILRGRFYSPMGKQIVTASWIRRRESGMPRPAGR